MLQKSILLSLFFLSILSISVFAQPYAYLDNMQDTETQGTELTQTQREQITAQMANTTIPFIANNGQFDENVTYSAKTFGGTIFVTKEGEIVYGLPKYEESAEQPAPDLNRSERPVRSCIGGIALKEHLINANISQITAEEQAPTKVSYFIGNDKSKWQSAISTYNLVSFGEVYDGITLKLKARGNNVEKLFYVQPGADPTKIRLKIEGATNLKVNENGELQLTTDLGNITFTKPAAYQQDKQIQAAYWVNGNEYGFSLGDYDKTKELIIDPLLASTFLGGNNYDYSYDITLDVEGNVYIIGETHSPDFPATAGVYDTSFNGGGDYYTDVFISKLNSSLTTLIASTFLGGSDDEVGISLTLDNESNVYVTGWTESSDFPTIAGAYDNSYNGNDDIFISKLNSSLTTLIASTFLGGSGDDICHSVTLDNEGNVYITGGTNSSDFPVTNDAYDTSYNGGGYDVFISKLNSSLTMFIASTFLGGDLPYGGDFGHSIILDSEGNVYVTGSTGSSNFPTTAGAYDNIYNSYDDIFISKLNSSLTTLIASTFLGGNSYDNGNSITLDNQGNVYVTGWTGSPDFPTTAGAYDTSHIGGNSDVIISKLDNSLSTLIASTFLGSNEIYLPNNDYGYSITLDSEGNVYVTGFTGSSDFPTTPGAYDTSYNSIYSNFPYDCFISKLNSSLTTLIASTFLGGSYDEHAYFITLDSGGNVYVTGYTSSSDFPSTAGAYDPTMNASSYKDVFISKLDPYLSADGSGISDTDINTPPNKFTLYDNYPNPFNPQTAIRFDVPDLTGFGNLLGLKLAIYDTQGKLVKTLINEPKEPGSYTVIWNGKNNDGNAVSSGVYLYRIHAGDFNETKKCILLK